jgi:hypothetical protein
MSKKKDNSFEASRSTWEGRGFVRYKKGEDTRDTHKGITWKGKKNVGGRITWMDEALNIFEYNQQ